MYIWLASLVKFALNWHFSTKTKAPFKLKRARCQIFQVCTLFAWRQWQTASIHSSSSNKWLISFSQLANDTKWHRILSYTVKMKVRQKWRKVCCLTCWLFVTASMQKECKPAKCWHLARFNLKGAFVLVEICQFIAHFTRLASHMYIYNSPKCAETYWWNSTGKLGSVFICEFALFLHGGSDKQPVFIAVGQTSDLFPFLSWQMIPSGTVCCPTL